MELRIIFFPYLVKPLVVTELLLAHAVDGGAHAAQVGLRQRVMKSCQQIKRIYV